MRYLKLKLSLLISVIGLVVYFVTIPNINENEFMDLTVQAGDATILDDYYFTGYIHPYSSFSFTSDSILVPANLPYLEKLDASDEMDIMLLKEEYPDFVNALTFSTDTYMYLISTDEDRLTSAHFEYPDDSHSGFYSNLNFRVLNKETNEIEEDNVARDVGSNIYYAGIVGIYENYPEINVLIDTRLGTSTHSYVDEVGEFSLVSYNFETKNMTETVLLRTPNYIEPETYSRVHKNHFLQVFHSSDETGESRKYVVNYSTGEMVEREESSDELLIISDDNRLYGIVDTTLVEYDGFSHEIVNEVELSRDFEEKKTMDNPGIELSIMDGKLFSILNDEADLYTEGADLKPSDVVVYDIKTGDVLVDAQFTFDGVDQVQAHNVYIDSVNKNTSKD